MWNICEQDSMVNAFQLFVSFYVGDVKALFV